MALFATLMLGNRYMSTRGRLFEAGKREPVTAAEADELVGLKGFTPKDVEVSRFLIEEERTAAPPPPAPVPPGPAVARAVPPVSEKAPEAGGGGGPLTSADLSGEKPSQP